MKNSKRILHLTLKRRWFDEIAYGTKRTEYRELKPYWTTRLENHKFDEVHFRNGYSPNSPFMRVEFLSMSINRWSGKHGINGYYAIHLGEVLEIRR